MRVRIWLLLSVLGVMPTLALAAFVAPPQQPPAVKSSTASPVANSVVEEPDADDDSEPALPVKKVLPVAKNKKAAVPSASEKKSDKTEEVQLYKVVLQVLNKVTAHVQTVEAPIGSVIRSGTIEIIAHRCWKSSPDEMPENAALLEISEIKQGEPPARIFQGWMFSSSPALSSLENAFYDVSVVGCEEQQ